MKHTTTTSILSGTNESPIVGFSVLSSNRDFVTRGVVVGVSILHNKTTGDYGPVTSVTATTIQATSAGSAGWLGGHGWFEEGWFGDFIRFAPGDFFEVVLAAPWIIQTVDGPVIDVECNRCGWSFPSKVLIGGLCKVCIDKPQRI